LGVFHDSPEKCGANRPTYPNGPEPTQWITYSQRPKSFRPIKGNFETWTQLGLLTMNDADAA